MKKLLFIFCMCTFFACGGDDNSNEPEEIVCPDEVQYAFRITVRNAADNSLLEDVSIRALDQTSESVFFEENTGIYVGLADQPGAYQLIIEKEDFQTVILSEENSLEDECGLVTKGLEVSLEPM